MCGHVGVGCWLNSSADGPGALVRRSIARVRASAPADLRVSYSAYRSNNSRPTLNVRHIGVSPGTKRERHSRTVASLPATGSCACSHAESSALPRAHGHTNQRMRMHGQS